MALLTLGAIFLVGLAADVVGRSTPLPRVSVLLLSGVVIGPAVLGILDEETANAWFPTLTQMALAMVGFLLGQSLSAPVLKKRGNTVLALSICKVLCAATCVFLVCIAVGTSITVALVLAGIAPATAPTATFDVVHESGLKNEFTETMLSIVAIDDAWGLILFSLLIAFATGNGFELQSLTPAMSEVGFSILLGLSMGIPMSMITGRIQFSEREGEPILAEALGFVFLVAGIAIWLELSPILASMSMGAVVATWAKHHAKPFAAIEGVEWPFMILFFVLAGSSLHLEYLGGVGLLLVAYILARGLGIYGGIYFGGKAIGAPNELGRWLGLTLMPQAGVALGLALLASQKFPAHAQTILTVVLASTVVLEIAAPPLTRWILHKQKIGGEGV